MHRKAGHILVFLAIQMALVPNLHAQTKNFVAKGNLAEIDVAQWRLSMTGGKLENPYSFTYEQLQQFPTVIKSERLECPGLFAYTAEWEGVPVSYLLRQADANIDYQEITFIALDGYTFAFTREEAESHLLFIALKVNGKPLPQAEGFPVRLVAPGFSGGRWVRWLSEIRVE
jgi:DMSO/TMAO reductase YedYZ molybdopterin-dependent catalytic subunit